MVGTALLAVVAAAALVIGTAPPAPGPSDAFTAAAAGYDVPREILSALGWAQSRLDHRAAGRTGGCGVMQLADDGVTDTLAAAAALTGRSRAQLCADEAANVAGAAAVLRSYADRSGLDATARADVDRWHGPVGRFAGAVGDPLARLFADSVLGRDAAGGPRSPDHPTATWSPAHDDNFRDADREKSHPIDYVVIHMTQGSYSGTLAWFQNPASEVSAHYTVRSSDGALFQSVREKDIGWHAGNRDYNARSIGIEHEGFIDNPAWFTDAMYRSSAALTRSLTEKYGIVRDRAHIVAHREVPGADHTDPGKYWNWTYYLQLVKGATGIGQGTVAAPEVTVHSAARSDREHRASGFHTRRAQVLKETFGFKPIVGHPLHRRSSPCTVRPSPAWKGMRDGASSGALRRPGRRSRPGRRHPRGCHAGGPVRVGCRSLRRPA
ncbi:N-acetylmuramoyl-L-alanine amidase [Asanoa sp. NPDC050611]|uniref:N-acetylmuramoyl-L-alanine amidase n=1 Tax=Asanoa sp. NPDC050611 TaxID=3157098 RepID=UPI0033C5985E